MSYQDDLNSEEWKSKRKEIIIRDNLKCKKCHNENLINDCLVGLLTRAGINENGTLFNYIGFNSIEKAIKKNVFIKNNNELISLSSKRFYLAFIDPEFENEPFGRLVGLRELKQINSGLIGDRIRTDGYELFVPAAAIWPFVPDRIRTDGYELPLTLFFLLDDGFKDKAGKLKGKINESDKWMYVPALHVHHTYYQINLKPWEYPNESLQTLCWVCHENLHKNQSVPFLDENGREFNTLTPCTRCFGAGWFPEYKHVQEGICFRCCGAKYEELIEPNVKCD